MGFFSNIIKKVGGFIASVFRDVEKPVKKVEDAGLKAFREFQEFIEKPIEKIEEVFEEREEPEEVEEDPYWSPREELLLDPERDPRKG